MRLRLTSRLFAALLCLFALAACGTNGVPTPAPPPPAPSTSLLPGLDELGAPLRRSASDVVTVDLTTGTLLNATVNGTTVELTSGADANSAVLFNIAPEYAGETVPFIAPYSLTFTHSGGDMWLVYGNYKTNRWRVEPTPFAAGANEVAVTLDKDSGNAAGSFAFAFIGTGGAAPVLEGVDLAFPDAPAVPGDPLEYRQWITAADGVTRLATSIYLPYDTTAFPVPEAPYPAVLIRTPYDKAQIEAQLISQGTGLNVAVLTQYWRGRLNDSGDWPDSDGDDGLFDDHAGPTHTDALDTVAWLEARHWYNGNLALTGPSALGVASYQSATALGSRIKSLFNQISAADAAEWVMLENGCFGEYNVQSFLLANGFPAGHLTTVEDAYIDVNEGFFDSFDYNAQASGVNAPGFHETGWWDVDVNETIRSWQSINDNGGLLAAGQQWLVIGPWTHGDHRGDAAGALMFPNSGDINDPQAIPAGYDGIAFLVNSLGRNPFFVPQANRVAFYMVGPEGDVTGNNNRWLTSASWPPLGLPLFQYLSAGGVMSDIPPIAQSSESYDADPADPIGTVGGGLLPFGALAAGPQDAAPLYAETAGSFLSFETPQLIAPVPVAGDITLTLRVEIDGSATQPGDTDVAAWLMDEDALGNRLIIANGIVRLSDYLARNGGQSVNLDTPYNVTFSLGSRAYNFETGHKLVLYVAGSNSPQYAVNPGNGEALAGGSPSVVQTVNVLYGDVGGQCQLLLPLLGP